MATRRKSSNLKAGRNGGFENVEATSVFELRSDGLGPVTEKTTTERWLSITGKHASPTVQALLYAFMMEIFGSALFGTLVGLAKWGAYSGIVGQSPLVTGFPLALVYGLAFWICTRKTFSDDYTLRRHLTGPLTLGYFLVGEIGLFGVVFYKIAQTLGALIGGGILSTLIGGTYVAGKLPVPLPVTTNGASSLTTAVCLEIFVPGVLVLCVLLAEFLNTNVSKKEKNYSNATIYYSGLAFLLILVLSQYGSTTFSDTAYLTGLFSGFNKVNADALSIPSMGQLNVGVYTDSVFGTGGSAWALYVFGPWAGGLAAGLFFWALFMFAAKNEGIDAFKKEVPRPLGERMTSATATNETSAQLPLQQLINPLLNK
ncbi:MAG: aquaporin [Nitrosomonas sp.]|nr:aquaporin [Nitrosomonas sp.]